MQVFKQTAITMASEYSEGPRFSNGGGSSLEAPALEMAIGHAWVEVYKAENKIRCLT